MASSVDVKVVIQHIVNGTLAENLCLICLMPLDELSEHIFTTICKGEQEYCIADVIEQLSQVSFTEESQHRVCSDCFVTASAAYKFYLSSKRSQEILNFYTNELQQNMDFIDTDLQNSEDSICISLPMFVPSTAAYDYDLEGLALQSTRDNADDLSDENESSPKTNKIKIKEEVKCEVDNDNSIVVVMEENGAPSFLKQEEDGTLNLIKKEEVKKYMKMFGLDGESVSSKPVPNFEEKVKQRRKRGPMSYMFCSQCPVKYRFVAKLKEHMKSEHNISLYVCQVCKATMEDEQEYNNHLKTHTNNHTCAICNMVFKKRVTIIAHLKKHEDEVRKISNGSHICELCGLVLEDEEHLKHHYDKKHDKKYTCYYCGKMYKGELSFDSHIKKHEMLLQNKEESNSEPAKTPIKPEAKKRDKKFHCDLCGGKFMDERALMWHTRLHTNERPHICDVCGRGFVSVNRRNQHAVCAHSAPARRCPLCPSLFHLRSMVNTHIKKVCGRGFVSVNRRNQHAVCAHSAPARRCPLCPSLFHLRSMVNTHIKKVCGRGFVSVNRRNQHAVCAHSAPARRCPLCPSLFHLRSMVNTHIKKVHLKAHKRRNRTSKYQEVYWRTEPVPIQELSVALQGEILELRAQQAAAPGWLL